MSIDNVSETEPDERVCELLTTIVDHSGHEIYRRWTNLQWTLTVLDNHYDEVLNTTASFEGYVHRRSHLEKKEIERHEVDIVRAFQGYFSCAYTLYEQAQAVKNELLCEQNGKPTHCDCVACSEILTQLRSCDVLPQWAFIQRLRAYFQHRRSPNIIKYSEGGVAAGDDLVLQINTDGQIMLQPSGFIEFQNKSPRDNPTAKDYVRDSDHIPIVDEIVDFHDSMLIYYGWFHGYMIERNKDIVKEYENLKKELLSTAQSVDQTQSDAEDNKSEDISQILEQLRAGNQLFRDIMDKIKSESHAPGFQTFTKAEIETIQAVL